MGQIALIREYFPGLSDRQKEQFEMLLLLYSEWNAKINLISRKDFEHFYERHVLHSLAIAQFRTFSEGQKVIDIGTGGGFPGIPLAILFPGVNFVLVDSIAKKIRVVNDIQQQLELENVRTENTRAEQLTEKADYIISRATAPLTELVTWTKHVLKKDLKNSSFPNGWITLKGGNLEEELKPFKGKVKVVSISDYFKEPYFETKKIVYLQI